MKCMYFICFTLLLCLTGCMGVYEGSFECPPGKGVGCKSVSEVNLMINRKELPLQTSDKKKFACSSCEHLSLGGEKSLEVWWNLEAFDTIQGEAF